MTKLSPTAVQALLGGRPRQEAIEQTAPHPPSCCQSDLGGFSASSTCRVPLCSAGGEEPHAGGWCRVHAVWGWLGSRGIIAATS